VNLRRGLARASGAPRTRVLILTGEPELCRLVRRTLPPACNVTGAAPVPMKLEAGAEAFDIVIIDLEPFDLDAITRIRRAHPYAEVVAICREYSEADCIEVLQRGADYVARPFRKDDLLARVRVAESRLFKGTGRPRYCRNGPLVMDLFDRKVFCNGQPVALSPSEMKVLMLLASRPGIPVAYDRILAAVGASISSSGRQALRNLVLRLRRRIERDPRCPEFVLTEPRFGYRLAEPCAEQARQSTHHCNGDGIVG
jgi:two-component system, OmpR family, KDP operon response regulator KdpE